MSTQVINKASKADAAAGTNNSRYLTPFSVVDVLAAKSNTGHTHDDLYYTETVSHRLEISTSLDTQQLVR